MTMAFFGTVKAPTTFAFLFTDALCSSFSGKCVDRAPNSRAVRVTAPSTLILRPIIDLNVPTVF